MLLTFLILINAARIQPLKVDPWLTRHAQVRATYLCTHPFTHDGWNGPKFFDLAHLKYNWMGENLAKGFQDKKGKFSNTDIHQAFLDSPVHKEVMTNPRYSYVGIAQAKCGITVELFGGYAPGNEPT